jgi:hypothetical protein
MLNLNCKDSGSLHTKNLLLAAAILASGISQGRPQGLVLTVGKESFTNVYVTVGKDKETVTFFPKKAGGWTAGESYEGEATGLDGLDEQIEQNEALSA